MVKILIYFKIEYIDNMTKIQIEKKKSESF